MTAARSVCSFPSRRRIDDKEVGKQRIERTVVGRFGIDTFGVGCDTGSPVARDYRPPLNFTGEIEKVKIVLGDPGLSEEEERVMREKFPRRTELLSSPTRRSRKCCVLGDPIVSFGTAPISALGHLRHPRLPGDRLQPVWSTRSSLDPEPEPSACCGHIGWCRCSWTTDRWDRTQNLAPARVSIRIP